jgi:hypothetical protein
MPAGTVQSQTPTVLKATLVKPPDVVMVGLHAGAAWAGWAPMRTAAAIERQRPGIVSARRRGRCEEGFMAS